MYCFYVKEEEKGKNQTKKFWFPNSEVFFPFLTLRAPSPQTHSCLPTLYTQGLHFEQH